MHVEGFKSSFSEQIQAAQECELDFNIFSYLKNVNLIGTIHLCPQFLSNDLKKWWLFNFTVSLRDAKSIYDKYIDDGSTSSLALPRKIKQIVDGRPFTKFKN